MYQMKMKLPWSSRQCIGLLDKKPGFEPQVRHKTKYEKYFLGDLFTADFWQMKMKSPW